MEVLKLFWETFHRTRKATWKAKDFINFGEIFIKKVPSIGVALHRP
jgi:hypothetical protein